MLHPELAREHLYAAMAHERRARQEGRPLPDGWRTSLRLLAAAAQQPTPDQAPAWLTLDEAASYARVSPRTLDSWRRDGLPAHRHGRRVLVSRDDLDAWIVDRAGPKSATSRKVVRNEPQTAAARPPRGHGGARTRPDPAPAGADAPEDHP